MIGGISRKLIEKYAGGAKPFFVYASFVAPHHGGPAESDDPWMPTPARPKWVRGKFDAQVLRAPGIPRDGGKVEADISDKPRFMRRVPEPGAPTRRALRKVTRQRAESLYVLDGQVKAIVRTLKNTGEWRNTVLMFTSDNGYLLGEHRQRLAKIKGHEPSIRVPFLVTGPGMRSGERRTDPITTVDLTATILDLANATGLLTARHSIDGASRVPTMMLGDQGWTTAVVTEGHLWPRPDLERGERYGFTGAGRAYIGLRTARYSLIRYITGAMELYDHHDDANQMTSRHDDPAYRTVKRQLIDSWHAYKDCRGASCQAPLPAELQADPTTAKELTRSFWRQVDAVHGY